MPKSEYIIEVFGCHDDTPSIQEFTEEQYNFLSEVFYKISKNSSYECMPTIDIIKAENSDSYDYLKERIQKKQKEIQKRKEEVENSNKLIL